MKKLDITIVQEVQNSGLQKEYEKSSKPTIFLIITLLLIVTVFALASVGLKLKYEQFLLQKDKAEKIYKSESQRKIKLTAEYQTVTAEERIVAVAGI
ncbi:MAG: hypothetical protein MZV64_22020 [Ignavibacteriales bacterium]|nr:hypothetical protein [Ignavibacteriales bacterium]